MFHEDGSPIFSLDSPSLQLSSEQVGVAIIVRLGGRVMIKKLFYEELTIHIDKEELAQLLGADPGFSVEHVEEEKGEIRFMLSRKTTLDDARSSAPKTDISRE
jgi:hypothetical protein